MYSDSNKAYIKRFSDFLDRLRNKRVDATGEEIAIEMLKYPANLHPILGMMVNTRIRR